MKISVFQLRLGWFARPQNQLGTCGWSPFAWQITHGRTAQKAFDNFKKRHNITEECELIIE